MIRQAKSIFRNDLFKGKVAIVTGGGSGIGKSIAHELRSLGCSVVLASRDISKLEKAREDIEKSLEAQCGETLALQCNIRKENEVNDMVDQTLAHFKRIDFLVNNGGGQFSALTEDISLKGWNAVIDTNLNGMFNCSKAVYLKHMKEHGGSIVSITVNNGNGFPGMSHSGAARAGVENLTKTLSVEWAHSGVRLNTVAPGIIWNETAVKNYPNGQEIFEQRAKKTPAQRMGSVEEVSAAVLYLLSPAAAFVTATNIHVDGGWSLYGNMYEVPSHSNCPPYGDIGSNSKL